jgi:hypothetical protein
MEERMRFDKFTERARKVLSLAQEEAQRFNHNYIGTEHLLLGLIREGEGTAAHVLIGLGVELPKARQAVEFIIGRGDRIVLGEIGLTPRSKKVIELAVDEARRLNHHYIGTEHILLGLIREGEGIAAGVLESLGVNLEKVRVATIQVLNGQEITNSTVTPSAPRQDLPVKMLRPAIVVLPGDTAAEVARHLDERLVATIGREHVFNTGLPAPLGWDWREHLRHQIGRCNVVLAVIGPAWLPETDEQGHIRDENDPAYIALTRALQLRKRIVPLFVQDASFPLAERIPEVLRDIVYYSGMALRADPLLNDDITRLIQTLQAMEWE